MDVKQPPQARYSKRPLSPLLPAASNTDALRISCCIGYGIVVYALLYWDKTDWLSIGLGVVLMAMVLLFLIVDIRLGVDFAA